MDNYIRFMSIILFFKASCSSKAVYQQKKGLSEHQADSVQTSIGPLILPPPDSTESVRNESKMVDWPEGKTPTAPEGFEATKFASDLNNPRYSYVGPNGDLFAVEINTKGSADQITIFLDANEDGDYESRETFLEDLNQPFGMLILNNMFYVANTDCLCRKLTVTQSPGD